MVMLVTVDTIGGCKSVQKTEPAEEVLWPESSVSEEVTPHQAKAKLGLAE